MILESLSLKYFKNYSDCSFSFNPKFNFIYGDNGNGKTNLLEAISFLCYTKSFLLSSESDCIKYGKEKLEVTGEFTNSLSLKSRVFFEFDRSSSRKTLVLNNEPIIRQSSFFGKIPLVILSPGDIKLTTGTPNERRRSFDILISQFSRLYYDELKDYNRTLRQKNSLLKENFLYKKYSNEKIREMVEMWNDELTKFGSRIILKRISIVREFQKHLENNFENIVDEAYVPQINYENELIDDYSGEVIDENSLTEGFRRKLSDKYPLEIKRGVSLIGPQRDNYVFSMLKKGDLFDLKSFASQGEHKTFIVALRLSEYSFLNDKLEGSSSGEPILLLDDVFSELDKGRIEKICGFLPKFRQVFVTTTDWAYLNTLKKYLPEEDISTFNIVNGSIKANS